VVAHAAAPRARASGRAGRRITAAGRESGTGRAVRAPERRRPPAAPPETRRPSSLSENPAGAPRRPPPGQATRPAGPGDQAPCLGQGVRTALAASRGLVSGSEARVRRQSLPSLVRPLLGSSPTANRKRARAGVRGVFRDALVRKGCDGGRRKRRGAARRRRGASRRPARRRPPKGGQSAFRPAGGEGGGGVRRRAPAARRGRPCFSPREASTRVRPGARSPPPSSSSAPAAAVPSRARPPAVAPVLLPSCAR
jgi:hypothetical protein